MSKRLDPGQYERIQQLVGASVAAEDRAALERSYQDYRSAMDQLRDRFERAQRTAAAREPRHD